MQRITKAQWNRIEPHLPKEGWTRRCEFVRVDGNDGQRQVMSVNGVPMIHIDVANNHSKSIVSVAKELLNAIKQGKPSCHTMK